MYKVAAKLVGLNVTKVILRFRDDMLETVEAYCIFMAWKLFIDKSKLLAVRNFNPRLYYYCILFERYGWHTSYPKKITSGWNVRFIFSHRKSIETLRLLNKKRKMWCDFSDYIWKNREFYGSYGRDCLHSENGKKIIDQNTPVSHKTTKTMSSFIGKSCLNSSTRLHYIWHDRQNFWRVNDRLITRCVPDSDSAPDLQT